MNTATLIGIILGVPGLVIAWLTYKKSFPKKSKEETDREEEHQALLVFFKTTQRLAKEVRESLAEYAAANHSLDADMYPGITYKVAIQTMTESHQKCLSDDIYNGLLSEKYTKPQIRLFYDDLNTQYKALVEMKNQLMVYKNSN